jgi:hypothetical protein
MGSQAGVSVVVIINRVPVGRLDVGWVLERAPWQLRERPAVVVVALCLHLESTFLRHGRVPARVAASDLWCMADDPKTTHT